MGRREEPPSRVGCRTASYRIGRASSRSALTVHGAPSASRAPGKMSLDPVSLGQGQAGERCDLWDPTSQMPPSEASNKPMLIETGSLDKISDVTL